MEGMQGKRVTAFEISENKRGLAKEEAFLDSYT
jgi:hypothetical protein